MALLTPAMDQEVAISESMAKGVDAFGESYNATVAVGMATLGDYGKAEHTQPAEHFSSAHGRGDSALQKSHMAREGATTGTRASPHEGQMLSWATAATASDSRERKRTSSILFGDMRNLQSQNMFVQKQDGSSNEPFTVVDRKRRSALDRNDQHLSMEDGDDECGRHVQLHGVSDSDHLTCTLLFYFY